jgi:hypothetical protein
MKEPPVNVITIRRASGHRQHHHPHLSSKWTIIKLGNSREKLPAREVELSTTF